MDVVSIDVVVEDIKELLVKVCEKCEVVLQWLSSHVGVKGNEWADVEAGSTREEDQKSIGIHFESVKGYIRRRVKYGPKLEVRLKEAYGRKIDRVN